LELFMQWGDEFFIRFAVGSWNGLAAI
jgi:hypothetical protein